MTTETDLNIRDKSYRLIKYALEGLVQDPKKTALKIENKLENISIDANKEFCTNKYSMYTVKVLENLKNRYVIDCINNKVWNPEDIVLLLKDELNPTKWQQIQDTRLPKNVKERRKGLNKCPRCKSWYTTCTGSAQLRSADEPMTNFMECEDCYFRWKM
jgi:DNA-directed RNA polymerase subunit M/transcription elongation factor TFIIS